MYTLSLPPSCQELTGALFGHWFVNYSILKFFFHVCFSSDYEAMSPGTPSSQGLPSPYGRAYGNSSGRLITRSPSPADSDTSGISSDASETSLMELMVRISSFPQFLPFPPLLALPLLIVLWPLLHKACCHGQTHLLI